MEYEDDNIIILNDEDGNDVEFEFLDFIEYDGEEYVVLLPADEDAAEDEVIILKIEELDDESERYVSIEDESVLQAVFARFKENCRDIYNFED